MVKKTAKKVALKELEKYKDMSFQNLTSLLGKIQTYEVSWDDDQFYSIEIHAVWDDKPDGNLRIFCDVSKGIWSSMFPHTECLLITPDGNFIEEEDI